MTTIAASDVPGKAARILLKVATSGSLCDESALSLGFEKCRSSAGNASKTSNPAESATESAGRRSTRSITAGQKRDLVESVCRWGRKGMRPRSMRGPSSSSTAGSTVTDPATAQDDHGDRGAREPVEDLGADEVHARHRNGDGCAGHDHRPSGRARRELERLV